MFGRLPLSCSVAVIVILGAGIAYAEPSQQDKDFVADAASGGMLEVKLGQFAADNGVSDDVKKFGQHMVEDHTKGNEKLKAVAAKEGLDLPKDLSDKDQKTLDRLEKLKGAEFDKAYMADMVQDHTDDVAGFSKEASDGTDTDIKAYASDEVPMLKHHLAMAEDINKKLGN